MESLSFHFSLESSVLESLVCFLSFAIIGLHLFCLESSDWDLWVGIFDLGTEAGGTGKRGLGEPGGQVSFTRLVNRCVRTLLAKAS